MSRRTRRQPDDDDQGTYVASPRVIWAAILFCMVFAGVGVWNLVSSLSPYFWKSVPCEILQFEMDDHAKADPPFTARVRYRFEWQGGVHESTKAGIAGWKNTSEPMALLKRFSETPKTQCYLPGTLPENAVLLRPQPKWGGCLFFVLFGVCVGWILFQADRTRDQPTPEVTRRILLPVALLFGTPGMVMTIGMSLPVWIESIEARGWKETPAKVLWSEVRVIRGDKSTNYHADICYEYEAAGRTWKNNRIRPGDATGFLPSPARELASSYPSGLVTRCLVHPTQPERAVLLASPGWAILLTLFPLPFLAIGFFCVREVVRLRKQKRPDRESDADPFRAGRSKARRNSW